MKLTLQELTHAHRLLCPYCERDRLSCTGQAKGGETVPAVLLQCADCGCKLRLVFEGFTDGRTELWLRDQPAIEDLKAAAAALD